MPLCRCRCEHGSMLLAVAVAFASPPKTVLRAVIGMATAEQVGVGLKALHREQKALRKRTYSAGWACLTLLCPCRRECERTRSGGAFPFPCLGTAVHASF